MLLSIAGAIFFAARENGSNPLGLWLHQLGLLLLLLLLWLWLWLLL